MLLSTAAKNDWRLPQSLPNNSSISMSIEPRYGFLDAYSGYFRYVGQSPNEVNELGDLAESAPEATRLDRRTAHEDAKWDEDYYL